MMKVVGEEGTSQDDYVVYLKGDMLDAVYLQQNSFDDVDKAASPDRQRHVFNNIIRILGSSFSFTDKEEARTWFNRLRQKFIDYNYVAWQGAEFKTIEDEMLGMIKEKSTDLDPVAEALITN
jgi:V/A-type H+-transporting ATPase subunit A